MVDGVAVQDDELQRFGQLEDALNLVLHVGHGSGAGPEKITALGRNGI